MKKHLLTFLGVLFCVHVFAQTPTLTLSIAEANMLPSMKPSSAHFKVDRVYGINLQSEYYFVYGTPTSPLSPFLSSLHLNIPSTYIDPSTGQQVVGYWTTEKVYGAFDNTIDFRKSMTGLYTLTMAQKSDSLRIATDSVRLETYKSVVSSSLNNKLNIPNGTSSQYINGQGNLMSFQWLNDSVIVIGDKRWVKLAGNYSDPAFINSLSSTKVTGLSTVATSGDYNDLLNKPVLSSYLLSSTAASTYYPLTNPNGYISSVPAQSFASLTGKPTTLAAYGITDAVSNTSLSTTLAGYATTSALTSGLANKQATLVSGTNIKTVGGTSLLGSGDVPFPAYTAGTGISIASNVVTNTAPDQTVVLTGSNGITTSGTYPNLSIQQTTPTYNNAPARTIGTSFRPSTTRPTRVSYTVSITTAISLLNLNSAGSVALQVSSDNVNFTTINSAGISRTLNVSVSVGLNDTSMLNIQGEVPAGFYCRLFGTTSGGGTVSFTSGQEVTY